MSSPVNGRVHKHSIVSIFRVAADLIIYNELLVLFRDWPSEVLDPSLGAISGDRAVSVTRVHKHLVLASELRIDPDGAFSALGVAQITFFFAKIPLGNVLRDM